MRGELTRRQLLGSVAVGVAAATAGCSGSSSTETVQVAVSIKVDSNQIQQIYNETVGKNPGPKAYDKFEKQRKEFVTSETEDARSQLKENEKVTPKDAILDRGLILVETVDTYLDDLLALEFVRSIISASEFESAKENLQTTTPS